jgi:hypothetical protein
MGAPTSSLFSEIYLQYIEHTLLLNILIQSHILGYFRYVDDILIVYNAETTNIYEVLDKFNNITPSIQYTTETEQGSKINFLDLTITKTSDNHITFSIFRKPTATDTLIPQDSCHPIEHKMSPIRYLLNRNTTHLLTPESRQRENVIINHILRANQYYAEHKTMRTITTNTIRDAGIQSKKWAKFTYTGKEVRTITKLFKHTNLNIAFTTKNTIGRLLSLNPHIRERTLYNRSGEYQLTCPTCKMKYIGQTSRRSFHIRYKEHLLDYKQGNMKSNFAKHLIEQRHTPGTIEDTMNVVHITSKVRLLNVIEKFYIYRETKINDRNTVTPNIIFDTLLHMNE